MSSHDLTQQRSRVTGSVHRVPRGVVIQAQGLTKRFGSITAVDDLSFTVRPGLVTGLLGPNGAGKSTTMRMILGLDRPTRGRALIDGVSYSRLRTPLRRWVRCWTSMTFTADVPPPVISSPSRRATGCRAPGSVRSLR